MKKGFAHSDITVLSLRGLNSATLNLQGVENYTLSRFTGSYDPLGNQIFETGQIRFDSAQRFKGQQSPAVILTDVDPDESRLEASLRAIFSAATRATVALDMLVRADNPACRRFLA
ncbi:ATP-binding domain-containing protein [Microvirga aerilata]